MTIRHQALHAAGSALALATLLACTPVIAAGKTTAQRGQEQYRRDLAFCYSGKYVGDHQDCLSEASTALAATQPVVVDPDPGRYLRNALRRCEALKDADRQDCIARIEGQGTTSGSVAGGGIYRELVTREVAPPAAGLPASGAATN